MRKQTSSLAGFIVLCLFLTPFFVIGVGALAAGLVRLAGGAGFSEDVIALLGIGVMFTAVSLGFFAAIFYGRKKQKEQEQLRARYADEPWLWKAEWRTGRVASSNTGTLFILWVFAVAFSGFSIPLTVKAFDQVQKDGWKVVAFTGLFALIGLAMLGAAIRATVAWFRFGQSYCELITNPGVVGGWFKCAVHGRVPLTPNDTVRARLSCIRRHVTGSGKNRSVRETVKWQEENAVDGSVVEAGSAGAAIIPVAFYVPRECQATTLDDNDDRILWRLEITADIPGVDYSAKFEVPVFVTPESSDVVPNDAARAQALTQEQVLDYARTSKIRIGRAPEGGTEIYVPPRRTLGVAFGATLFWLTWTGVIGVMVSVDVPLFMTALFALFDILILVFVLTLWAGSTRTVIDGDTITVRQSLLGISNVTRFAKDEITKVAVDVGMQSGDRAYYRVQLYLPGNKKRAVATGIRDKNEARWLANILETSLEAG